MVMTRLPHAQYGYKHSAASDCPIYPHNRVQCYGENSIKAIRFQMMNNLNKHMLTLAPRAVFGY